MIQALTQKHIRCKYDHARELVLGNPEGGVTITGRAWKYGANVEADQIIARQYSNLIDPAELGKHAMEDLDAEFAKKVEKGDVIVAGPNFGCGPSREVAPLSLKGAGVSAVIAASSARMFCRNAVNIGLPIFESPEAVEAIEQGHYVEIDPASGILRDLDTQEEFKFTPFPEFMRMIIAKGGLLPYIEERLAQRHADRVGDAALEQKADRVAHGQVPIL
jgi:3-isopropylmalate/(R)-2-methylmalate dehydratase small subunit